MEKMKPDGLKITCILRGSELIKKIRAARLKFDRLERLAIDASYGEKVDIIEQVEVMQSLRNELDRITVDFIEMGTEYPLSP